jgi:predicted  nucleic acid-binding Zn-ribbon protein
MAYRTDIRPYERLDIAAQYALDHISGTVSRLQDIYHLSRGDIYAISAKALGAFEPQKPGPKPDNLGELQRQVATLQTQNEALRQQVAELESKLCQSVLVDKRRIEDLILTALVTPPSHEGISDLVAAAYGEKYRSSTGKASQLTNHYGTIAGLILLDDRVTSLLKNGLADEIFFSHKPVLVVTDPKSTAIGAIELSTRRDGDSWQQVFKRFPNLALIVSDLAKGLRKGIKILPQQVDHQGDSWHLFREIHRLSRKLEATTSSLLQEEEKARKKLKKGKIYQPTLKKVKAKVSANLEWMETYYQAIEKLVEAFDPVAEDQPGQFHLRTKDEALIQLDAVIATLKGLPDRRINKLVKELKGRKESCFVFLDHLQARFQSLPVEFRASCALSPDQVRSWILQEIILTQHLYQDPDQSILQAWHQLWKKLNQQLMPYLKNYQQVRRAILKLIGSPARASSLVEMINSLLRRFQQIKRHTSQEFLYLAALHHNMKSFGSDCKRHGRSPFQILGIDFGTNNWLDLLRSYQLAAA